MRFCLKSPFSTLIYRQHLPTPIQAPFLLPSAARNKAWVFSQAIYELLFFSFGITSILNLFKLDWLLLWSYFISSSLPLSVLLLCVPLICFFSGLFPFLCFLIRMQCISLPYHLLQFKFSHNLALLWTFCGFFWWLLVFACLFFCFLSSIQIFSRTFLQKKTRM